MMTKTTLRLFEELSRLIPGLPKYITRLELVIAVDLPPTCACEFMIEDAGELVESNAVFDLTVREADAVD